MDKKREAALTALMTNDTLTAAAAAAGISRRTLFTYLHDDRDFANEFQRRQSELAVSLYDRLAAERELAITTIREIMSDTTAPAAARIKAAGLMLETIDAAARQVNAIATANVEWCNRDTFSFSLF